MASFSSTEFRTESWSLFGVGMAFVVFRLGARTKKLGFSRLQFDDYLMVNAAVWYTVLVTAANKIISGGGSNFMTPEEQAALTPAIIRDRESGSKWVLVSEQAMIITIWSCKLCMLFIYHRLTEGLKQRKLINLVVAYVVLGFVGTQLALFLSCRPFKDYWSVPPGDSQCATYYNYGYAEAVFNITSDICVLLVAIPLLLQVQLPIQQKAVLVGIFGMGFFVIAAAILNKVYAYVPWLVSMYYLNWYIREASCSIYVANLPAIWSLLRDIFPSVARWGFKTKKSSGFSGSDSGWATTNRRGSSHLSSRSYAMRPFGRLGSASGEFDQNPNSSQEQITNVIARSQDFPSEKEVTITEKTSSVDDDGESGPNIYHTVP